MDNLFEQKLLNLNSRYQKAKRNSIKRKGKLRHYLLNLKDFKIAEIFEDLKYGHICRSSFRTSGNRIKSISKPNNISNSRIAVYTCIIGKYDSLLEPIQVEPGVDYFVFCDFNIPKDSIWKKIDVTGFKEYKEYSKIQLNRKIKMLPYDYLSEYEYTVYVDGNIEIVTGIRSMISNMGGYGLGIHYHKERDCIYDEAIAIRHYKKADMKLVNSQLQEYRSAGMPVHFGLFENSILVRNHHCEIIRSLMQNWWAEYLKYPTRDQLSLPFLVWNYKIPETYIFILGYSINDNPRFNRDIYHI